MTSTDIAVFPILADPDQNNLQSIQLLVGREVVSGRMDGCRASVLHSCSCRDRPKLGRLQYTVRSRYKRIVYKRIWVASLPFQSVWATFSSYWAESAVSENENALYLRCPHANDEPVSSQVSSPMHGAAWLPLDHWELNDASLLALTEVSAPRWREILPVCIDPRRMCRASLPSNVQCRVKVPGPHTPEYVFRIGKKANVFRPHLSSTALPAGIMLCTHPPVARRALWHVCARRCAVGGSRTGRPRARRGGGRVGGRTASAAPRGNERAGGRERARAKDPPPTRGGRPRAPVREHGATPSVVWCNMQRGGAREGAPCKGVLEARLTMAKAASEPVGYHSARVRQLLLLHPPLYERHAIRSEWRVRHSRRPPPVCSLQRAGMAPDDAAVLSDGPVRPSRRWPPPPWGLLPAATAAGRRPDVRATCVLASTRGLAARRAAPARVSPRRAASPSSPAADATPRESTVPARQAAGREPRGHTRATEEPHCLRTAGPRGGAAGRPTWGRRCGTCAWWERKISRAADAPTPLGEVGPSARPDVTPPRPQRARRGAPRRGRIEARAAQRAAAPYVAGEWAGRERCRPRRRPDWGGGGRRWRSSAPHGPWVVVAAGRLRRRACRPLNAGCRRDGGT